MSTIAHDAGAVRPEARTIAWADLGLLAARLGLGVVFFAHGAQKVLGWFGGPGLSATVNTFTGPMHIPLLFAYLAIFTEFLGGIALIVGVLARLAALGIIVEMLVAVAKVHLPNGFFMNWGVQPGHVAAHGEGFEYHVLAIALALVVLLAGPGRLAVADWERRLLHRSAGR